MRPAAELDGEARHGDHTDPLAVLLTEERHGPRRDGLVPRAFLDLQLVVAEDVAVDEPLDVAELLLADRLVVGDIEPEAIRGDERARLPDVRADDGAQRRMEQVGRGVVALDVVASLGVDLGRDLVARAHGALAHLGDVQAGPGRIQAYHVAHGGLEAVGNQASRIGDLSPRFQVKGRLAQQNVSLVAGLQFFDLPDPPCFVGAVQTGHFALRGRRLVADERIHTGYEEPDAVSDTVT